MANGWIASSFECSHKGLFDAAQDAAERMGEGADSGDEAAE